MPSSGRSFCTGFYLGCCPSDMQPFWLVFASVVVVLPAGAARLKDLVDIEGVRDNQLMGYGLVVGLAGTGDGRQTTFPAQSVANMLERMGVSVPATAFQIKNTAAVMVTA